MGIADRKQNRVIPNRRSQENRGSQAKIAERVCMQLRVNTVSNSMVPKQTLREIDDSCVDMDFCCGGESSYEASCRLDAQEGPRSHPKLFWLPRKLAVSMPRFVLVFAMVL